MKQPAATRLAGFLDRHGTDPAFAIELIEFGPRQTGVVFRPGDWSSNPYRHGLESVLGTFEGGVFRIGGLVKKSYSRSHRSRRQRRALMERILTFCSFLQTCATSCNLLQTARDAIDGSRGNVQLFFASRRLRFRSAKCLRRRASRIVCRTSLTSSGSRDFPGSSPNRTQCCRIVRG